MKKKTTLKDKEKTILEYIHKQGGAVTPNEISVNTGISYITVLKYLRKLVKEKILIEEGNNDG